MSTHSAVKASVTAVTVTYRTGPRLHECLYALKSDPDIAEIIIVDNGNAPAEAAWIDNFVDRTNKARLLRDAGNIGFGAGMNLGIASALGEYILAINPDAVIRQRSVGPMIDALTGQPTPTIVGGKIFGVDGKEQRGGRRNTLTLKRALGLSKWTLEDDPAPTGPLEVGAISGAFFLMACKAFREMGGFDENYFLHFEDLDLCIRALDAGGRVIYQPAAAALHYTSTTDVSSKSVQAHKATSLRRYFTKFPGTGLEGALTPLLVPLMSAVMRRREVRRQKVQPG